MDLFVEVTNITKGNGIWAHFALTRCFSSQIQLSRPIQKEDVQIETFCRIFMDNDLTNITEDHFEIKLIARLLDQIYVVQPPMFPPRYDDAPPQEYEYSKPHTRTDGTRPSAPQFTEHLHSLLTNL